MPILRAGNIGDVLTIQSGLVWVPPACVSEEQLLRPGDLAICLSSGSPAVVGKTAQLRQPWYGSVGAFCGIIRPRRSVNSDYLVHWIRTDEYRQWRDGQARGANIQNLRFSQLSQVEIPLPPLAEQNRLAALLTRLLAAVDKVSNATQQRLAAAEALPAAYLREVFEGPEASAWEIRRLGELVARPIRTGISKPTHPESATFCLTLSAVRGRDLLLNACKPVAVTERQAAGNWVQPGSFYVVRGNGNRALVGRGAFAPDPMPTRVLFPDLLFELTLDPERIDPAYFGWLWSSPAIRREIEARAKTAAGIYKINTANLISLPLTVPPMAEQRRISAALHGRVEGAERLANLARGECDGIDAIPAALLRQAFNG